MGYIVSGGIVLFGLIVVYVLYRTTQDSPNIVIPTEDFQVDTMEVSYVFLPTDSSDEYGRVKGWSYKRNQTITTKALYKGTSIKFGDKVSYKYVGNQIDNVELV